MKKQTYIFRMTGMYVSIKDGGYAINVIDRQEQTMKVWKFGRATAKSLKLVMQVCGDPTKYDLVIESYRSPFELEFNFNRKRIIRIRKELTKKEKNLKLYNLKELYDTKYF